ncbi:MAG TPA: amino acid racemase [Rickettsiales bacterium]|nr:amino acid racemase [Rickettsiales bacterium]
MKRVGIIGGLSSESTILYYQEITRYMKLCLGSQNTTEFLIYQINMENVVNALQSKNNQAVFKILLHAAQQLELFGVDGLVIPCNTLHLFSDQLEQFISVPLINIMNSVGKYVISNSMKNILLLGSKYIASHLFYKDYLQTQFGISVSFPKKDDADFIHHLIFNHLCLNKMTELLQYQFLELCEHYYLHYHLDGIVLACTELSLIEGKSDYFIDSLKLHTKDIVEFSITQG